MPSLELRPQILVPESALEAASSPKLAPSRVQRTSGNLPAPGARPQPYSPGSPAAGAAGAASANSEAGCCGCCSPWSSSELMCWGFACLRLDMVRASGRLESRHKFLELGNLPPFGRNAHVPVIIIINNALRFIMSPDS